MNVKIMEMDIISKENISIVGKKPTNSFFRYGIFALLLLVTFTQIGYAQCTGPVGDCDGDTYLDGVDDDDDNDGILDALECPPLSAAEGDFNTITGTVDNYTQEFAPSSFEIAYTNGNAAASNITSFTESSAGASQFYGDGVSISYVYPSQNAVQVMTFSDDSYVEFAITDIDATGENHTVVVYDENGVAYADLTPFVKTSGWGTDINGDPVLHTDLGSNVNVVHAAGSVQLTPIASVVGGEPTFTRANMLFFDFSSALVSRIEVQNNSSNGEPGFLFSKIVNDSLCPDADNDGTPDFQDTDSDGDGCADYREGGAFLADGTDMTVVDANGVPTAAGAGQTIGYSQNITVNYCIDTDLDGVPDDLDLDNDNDGILDTDECPVFSAGDGDFNTIIGSNNAYTQTFAPSNFEITYTNTGGNNILNDTETSSGTSQFYGDGVSISYVYPETGAEQVMTFSAPAFMEFAITDIDASNEKHLVEVYDENGVIYPNPSAFISTSGYGTDASGNPTLFTDLGTNVIVTPVINGVELTPISSIAGGEPTFTRENMLFFDFSSALVSRIEVHNISSAADVGPGFLFSVIKENTDCPDTDNDGVDDYLDEDSDDDGCFDAIEGGGAITAAQMESDGEITGNVDANGVPVLALGGQSIGSSQDDAVLAPACPTDCNANSGIFPLD